MPVQDGDTLQVGVGSRSDAVTYAIELKPSNNAQYRRILSCLGVSRFSSIIAKLLNKKALQQYCNDMDNNPLSIPGHLKSQAFLDGVRFMHPLFRFAGAYERMRSAVCIARVVSHGGIGNYGHSY